MWRLYYKIRTIQYGRVLLAAFFCVAITPFITHYYLTRRNNIDDVKPFHTRSTLTHDAKSADGLQQNNNELEHIQLSLKNELRELEGKRHNLLKEIQDFSNNFEVLRVKGEELRNEMQRRKQELDHLKSLKQEINKCPHLPFLKPPKKLMVDHDNNKPVFYAKPSMSQITPCSFSTCFNFQQCSFLKDFKIFIYNSDKIPDEMQNGNTRKLYSIFRNSPYFTASNDICLYIIVVSLSEELSPTTVENTMYNLPHWQGDGHNHIIINIGNSHVLKSSNIGRALVAQTSYNHGRKGFDIIIPNFLSLFSSDAPVWTHSQPQLPAYKKYFISFQGNYQYGENHVKEQQHYISIKDLKEMSLESKDIYFSLNCATDKKHTTNHGWQLCDGSESRARILKQSTFALILQSKQDTTMIRLFEALQYGAIPVIMKDDINLPFDEMIDWKKAAVILYNAQLPQLHFILRTIAVNDLLAMRRQAWFIWHTYLATQHSVSMTILAVLRTRLSLPDLPLRDVVLPAVFDENNQPVTYSPLNFEPIVEYPIKSPTFYRNFTKNNVYSVETWNTYPGALFSTSSDPFLPILPSSAAFLNSSLGFQPLGKGAGGAGIEFRKALGGNQPIEQFTVVMLTYEREIILMEALTRLANLEHLNKVIVIWNSPNKPSAVLKWPNIGVPIKVLHPDKNSLNNRFLPLQQIETDAVLSMDDDVHLRHDEMSFGFRVWREARDRIVGFPGRYHSWDLNYGGWFYNSNHSCELSMVLTGAAFFHKYYTYLYSYVMPEAIRNKVDEYMNCEDIAFNFLVSHVTRKPPIKVTSRWTFRCPGCPKTLSQNETHFNERHRCINYFVKVYGYMPLLRTQFRADSVLFKTRIPHDKTKCFTFI